MKYFQAGYNKDGLGLSKRLWRDSRRFDKDIGYIVEKGILAKKSAVGLAEDLEMYVRGQSRTDFNWGKCYPNLKHKKCSYEAQRLARTSISHTYQLATFRAAKDNPFVEGILWLSALNHARTCDYCRSMHNSLWYGPPPLDHPNGLCTMAPFIPKSMEDIGETLKDWVNGGDDPKIDRWLGIADSPEHVIINQEDRKLLTGATGASMIQPTLPKGGKPKGVYAKETSRGLIRQNETANLFALEGYDIVMLPDEGEGNNYGINKEANPDFLIEGIVFDCYAPDIDTTINNIIRTMRVKTMKQAENIVLNLDNYDGDMDKLLDTIAHKAGFNGDLKRLNQLFIVKDGRISPGFVR